MVESTSLGSSGNRVGSWKDVGGSQGSPLLCKEGRGEVERGPASGCFYPSSPPLTKGRNREASDKRWNGDPFSSPPLYGGPALSLPLLCKEGRGEVERGPASGCFYPSSPPLTMGRESVVPLIKGRESVVPLTKGRKLHGAYTKACRAIFVLDRDSGKIVDKISGIGPRACDVIFSQ